MLQGCVVTLLECEFGNGVDWVWDTLPPIIKEIKNEIHPVVVSSYLSNIPPFSTEP